LLFFCAMEAEASNIKDGLAVYAQATGQLINPRKCSILFGERCHTADLEAAARTSEVQQQGFEERYLRVPTPNGSMSKNQFQNLQQKRHEEDD
jgi:hypothetical protein